MSRVNKTTELQFLPNLCHARAALTVIVAAEITALIVALVEEPLSRFSVVQLAINSVFIQWVALSSAALLCALRNRLNRLSPVAVSLLVIAIVPCVALLFSLAGQALMNWTRGLSIGAALLDWERLKNSLIAVLLTSVLMRYFYLQYDLRRRRESELKARLEALQSRIRPHFLFNSMNSIASLIAIDPAAAEKAVEDLARLFRASLSDVSALVTLKDELALCHCYADIECLRLGERLQVVFDVDPALLSKQLPALVLQPLLENAVYHGIQPLECGGTITLKTIARPNDMLITITNPFVSGQKQHRGNRMALANIAGRMEAFYGRAGGVEVTQAEQSYRVAITIPYQRGRQ